MKRSNRAMILCPLALLLLLLGGCGSNESSPDASGPVRLSGVVEDGVIANARISLRDSTDGDALLLRCGREGQSRCETTSDASGGFTLEVPAGIDLTSLAVVAAGGRDRDTGVDFTGLELRTPLALHADDQTAIVTSPLTTLVAALHAQGLPLADAQQRVRDWLALPPTTKLTARPTASLDLQRRALLLTKIALELHALAPGENPFGAIGEKMAAEMPLLATDGASNSVVLTTLGLDIKSQERVIELQKLLAAAPDGAAATNSLKKKELMDILSANIRVMLSDATTFDETDADYQLNLKVLAETALRAAEAGGEVIPLGGTSAQRIARYILFTYDLRTSATLTLGPAEFSAKLQQGPGGILLESDPRIAELARSRSLYSVVSPLLLSELPGNDNQKRLAYFYGSDLSPHYQAEQLIGRVFDDAINDAIVLKIVEGKANAGLIDEARTIIATQIVQSEQKANAYRALGKALISFNRSAEARDELLRARDLYFKVIDSKGMASASNTDTINLHETAAFLRKAGYLDEAGTVLLYLADVAKEVLVTNPSAYGRLVVGTWNVADAYIAAGDLTAAAPIVESLYDLARTTPASLTGTVLTCKSRVLYLVETSKRYAVLGNHDRVLDIYNLIQALWSADGYQNLTGADSWSNLPGLVESLYRVGETTKALALADTIPLSYVNALGKTVSGAAFRASAFKLVATYEALNNSLDNALTIVTANFPTAEEKIEALTYFASNKGVEYIGLALIHANRSDEARRVLEEAELLLDGLTESTDALRYTYLIQRGYVKVADLFALSGDSVKAAALLLKAQASVAKLAGGKEIVNGLVDIALGYQQIGQSQDALDLLLEALTRADTLAGSLAKPEDAALLYEALIKAYLQVGDKEGAHGTIASFLQWTAAIHTPGAAYTGTANDDLAAKEVDGLLRGARYLVTIGAFPEAVTVLDGAKATADLIMVETTRLAKYIYPDPLNNATKNHLIGGYANARAYDQALVLALGMKYTTNRNQAIAALADFYVRRDDFPGTWVATIDSDGDGRPDFFNPLASAEEIAASGLILDDDSDGDTLADTSDFRPLYADLIKE